MATGAAVAAVAGTMFAIKAQRDAAKAEAGAARENAAAKREAALDLIERGEINASAFFVEGEVVKSKQRTQFAGKGFDISVGAPLSLIEETGSLVANQLILDKMEIDAKVKALRSGAEADERLAQSIRKSAKSGVLGTVASGIGSVAGAFK